MSIYRDKLLDGTLTLDVVQSYLLESATSSQSLVGFVLNTPDLNELFERDATKQTNLAVGGELVLVQYVLSDALAAASMWRVSSYLNRPVDKTLFYRTYAEEAFDFVERELQRMFPGTKDNVLEMRNQAFIVSSRDTD